MMTNISGFPEFLPREQLAFNTILEKIKKQFELYGFVPLDTPAVEQVSTLLAKGNDKEIYGLHRLMEDGRAKEKAIALRFDLTVPLARYVAQHYGQLTFPYRRYHIAPVWRGERPQSGRYRQFYQCDIDIVGDGALPLSYDAEALSVIHATFKAIGLKKFVIKVNHHCLLKGLIQSFGLSEGSSVMRTLDKAHKIDRELLVQELAHHSLHEDHIKKLEDMMTKSMSKSQWLAYLPGLCVHPEFLRGLKELEEVLRLTEDFGIPDECLRIEPTLARGLTYYTGIVSETQLLDYPALGSVCGGGRYDNLAESFSKKNLPGVGFSIGISRLIPHMIASGMVSTMEETPATVLVTVQNAQLMPYYIEAAYTLRAQNICTEVYLGGKPLSAQMKYAHKKGFKFALIGDEEEWKNKKIIVRSLSDSKQYLVNFEEAVDLIRNAF